MHTEWVGGGGAGQQTLHFNPKQPSAGGGDPSTLNPLQVAGEPQTLNLEPSAGGRRALGAGPLGVVPNPADGRKGPVAEAAAEKQPGSTHDGTCQ